MKRLISNLCVGHQELLVVRGKVELALDSHKVMDKDQIIFL